MVDRVHQRFVEQGLEAPCVVDVEVWRRRDHDAHAVSLVNLDIVSTSSLSGGHLPSCHATVYGTFGRIS